MTDIIKLGIYFILAGITLLFIGSLLPAGKAEFGGLIMIGPVPIAFGTSPAYTIIAMVIGIVLILLYFIIWRKYA